MPRVAKDLTVVAARARVLCATRDTSIREIVQTLHAEGNEVTLTEVFQLLRTDVDVDATNDGKVKLRPGR